MTHPADSLRTRLLRERLSKAKEKQESGGNGKSKNEDVLSTALVADKKVDNPKKETPVKESSKKPAKSKKAKPKKASAKKPAKKPVKKVAKKAKPPKKVATKKAATKKTKPTKKVKAKKPTRAKPKKVVKQSKSKRPTKKKTDDARSFDRDRTGDGLRPIEREIIEAVASSDGTLGILDIAHDMFGPKCGSEGPNSVRTIRNAIRIPIRYGIIEHSGRGRLCVTEAYAKNEGDLKSIVDTYREEVKRAARRRRPRLLE